MRDDRPSTSKAQPSPNKYAGILGKRFDLVSCQFAIHYFMENKNTLEQFVKNIDSVISDGGYFIGTCLDAMAVDAAFKDADNKVLTGKMGSRVIWQLTKLYDHLEAGAATYDKKIRVYLETINQPIDEYLVDLSTLEAALKTKDIVRLTEAEYKELGLKGYTGMFGDVFEGMKSSHNVHARRIVQELTDEEKRISFLNRWFVFRKRKAQT
jgi:hypothetical protein